MIIDLIPENDSPTTKSEKIDWIQERFNLERQLLVAGNSHQLDKPDWELTLDAIEHLAEILQKGAATPEMQAMLAVFLNKLLANSTDSPTAFEYARKTAQALLGLPNVEGRPTKKLNELRAVDAYKVYINAGKSDEAALEAAWLAYDSESDKEAALKAARRAYCEKSGTEQEKQRPLGDSNAFHRSIEKTINPLLHKAGARQPKKAGRPKKSSNKPS